MCLYSKSNIYKKRHTNQPRARIKSPSADTYAHPRAMHAMLKEPPIQNPRKNPTEKVYTESAARRIYMFFFIASNSFALSAANSSLFFARFFSTFSIKASPAL